MHTNKISMRIVLTLFGVVRALCSLDTMRIGLALCSVDTTMLGLVMHSNFSSNKIDSATSNNP